MTSPTLKRTPARGNAAARKRLPRPKPVASPAAADAIPRALRWPDATRLRTVAAELIAGRRKDLEAVLAANRKSLEGIQAVVKRQAQLLEARIAEWRSVAKVASIAGPVQSMARLDQLAKGAVRLSLAHFGELAGLAVQTQAEAFDVLRSRIRHDITELGNLHVLTPLVPARRRRNPRPAA